ncbi:MAG TPA: hypothetical protein VGM62_04130 [Chthoniobacterales bacterium]|jgi:hypothetical protein
MQTRSRKRWLIISTCAIAAIVVAIVVGGALLNPALTRYVESPQFRAEMEKETAKGLHFPTSEFGPIRRTGTLSARSDTFHARNGQKAMTSLSAKHIAARFNPFGVFLRRWQIDDLPIDRAEIGIQIYEPKPEPKPAKPWYHIFLPDRVYLKRVHSDDVDVTWPMRGEKGGIFHTHLVVTPHGRDFEYHANSGVLRNPLMPKLAIKQIHLLITKQLFTLYTLDVISGKGTVHGEGTAIVTGDKKADFNFKWEDVPVREWLPKDSRESFEGVATGDLKWTGNDYKLAAARMTGQVKVKDGRVSNLKFLDTIAEVTNRKDLAQLELAECRSKLRWHEGQCELSDIAIEQSGKFRIEGTASFGKKSLGGTLEIGFAPEYLEWLPRPEEVFTRESEGYLWTTVHLSGTLDAPQQDLSPRLIEAMKESPGKLLGAALRGLRVWLFEQ